LIGTIDLDISSIITANPDFAWFMVFNTTFNNISVISWRSVLLVEETGVHGENQTCFYNQIIDEISKSIVPINSMNEVFIEVDYSLTCNSYGSQIKSLY
jgi:hypothetical protein